MSALQLGLTTPRAALWFEPCSTWHPLFVTALREHYTGSRGAPPGKKLAWVVFESDTAIGVIGLGEPAYKLAPRRRLGLADARPLPATVCNFIFRRWGGEARGSDVLKAWHPVAEAAWEERYGAPHALGVASPPIGCS